MYKLDNYFIEKKTSMTVQPSDFVITDYDDRNYEWNTIFRDLIDELQNKTINFWNSVCEYLESIGYTPDDLYFKGLGFDQVLVSKTGDKLAWIEYDRETNHINFRSVNRDVMAIVLHILRGK